ncbi:MAG: hypothetical protein U0169_12645 [Polyangiaceae bacterium]
MSARAGTSRFATAACVVGASLLVAGAARANPLDTFGFGSRETAMGSAMVAATTGPAAGYYNPASLVRARSLVLEVGYFQAHHALRIDGRDTGVDPVRGVNVGLDVPGRPFGIPVAFGLALHVPDDRLSRIRAVPQERPRWELYDNRNQRLWFGANLAVQVTPWLAVGGGVSFMSGTRGRIDISGDIDVLDPKSSSLRHEVDTDLVAVRTPQAGVRIDLPARLALGATWRGEFSMPLDLRARVHGDVGTLTTADYALRTTSTNAFVPQQVAVGASWVPSDDVTLAFDLTWFDWSAYVPPVASLTTRVDVPAPVGGWPAGIDPPTAPPAVKLVPIAMRDRIVPHVGVEWRAWKSARVEGFLRAGWQYQESPTAPDRHDQLRRQDEHTPSLGSVSDSRRRSRSSAGRCASISTDSSPSSRRA